jgi:hypothetical protein
MRLLTWTGSLALACCALTPAQAIANTCAVVEARFNAAVHRTNAESTARYTRLVGHPPSNIDADLNPRSCPGVVAWARWRLTTIVPEAELIRACGGRSPVHMAGARTESPLRTNLNRWISTCRTILAGAREPRAAARETCTTPPRPPTSRTSPTSACFTARNTNSSAHCVYSYTYIRGGRRMSGTTLQPGGQERMCSLQEGVDIAFERWTLSGRSAR